MFELPQNSKLLNVTQRAAAMGIQHVMVGVSGGKDATVALDLCKLAFPSVSAYFMYFVPGLSFQEKYLCYLERRFDLTIRRVPHWRLTGMLNDGWFRPKNTVKYISRRTKITDVEHYLRTTHNVDWFATGEKCCDSLERNAMIKRIAGIDPKRRRIFPIAFWTHAQVFNYLKQRQFAIPPEYNIAGKNANMGSFSLSHPTDLIWCRENYPDDYRKIMQLFPLLEGRVLKHEQELATGAIHGKKSKSKS